MKLMRSEVMGGHLTQPPKIQPYIKLGPGPFDSAQSFTHTQVAHSFPPSFLPSFTFSFNFQMECCDATAGGEQHLKGLAFFISPRCICVDSPPCHCQIVCFTSSLSPLCDLKETSGQRDGWETVPPSLFHQADAKCGCYKRFPLEGWF